MQVGASAVSGLVVLQFLLATPIADVKAQNSRLVGCYDVAVGSWSGRSALADSRFFRIPARVNLTSVRSALASTDRTTYVMRAAPGERESAFEDATWSADSAGSRLLLRWFTPTFGIQARVVVSSTSSLGAATLDGHAAQWADHPPGGGSTASLSLRRVDCFAPPSSDAE